MAIKSTIKITGRVELDRHEVTQAILNWLKVKHGYEAHSVVYPPGVGELRAIVDVKMTTNHDVIDGPPLPPQKRTVTKKWTKRNKGVFDTIRIILNDRFSQHRKYNDAAGALTIGAQPGDRTFDGFWDEVKTFHPNLTRKTLKTYMCEKRQLGPNVVWDGINETITVRAPIVHVPGHKIK